MLPDNAYSDLKLQTVCEQLGFEYRGRLTHKHHTWVKYICPVHGRKGEQEAPYEMLERWVKRGHCRCNQVHRDSTDIKMELGAAATYDILDPYVKSNIKVRCKCNQCGTIWSATPNKLQQGRGCPICKWDKISTANRMSPEEYGDRLSRRHNEIQYLAGYEGAQSTVRFLCLRCDRTSSAHASRLMQGDVGCPYCNKSQGERLIAEWLDRQGIAYKREVSFPQCVSETGRVLRLDFYLPDYRCCVEYQGEQHYRPVDFAGRGELAAQNAYESLCSRDELKREFCIQSGMSLIEIPYWDKCNLNHYLNEQLLNSDGAVETVMPA